MSIISARKFPSGPGLLRVFIVNGCVGLCQMLFFTCIDTIMLIFFLSVKMIDLN